MEYLIDWLHLKSVFSMRENWTNVKRIDYLCMHLICFFFSFLFLHIEMLVPEIVRCQATPFKIIWARYLLQKYLTFNFFVHSSPSEIQKHVARCWVYWNNLLESISQSQQKVISGFLTFSEVFERENIVYPGEKCQ